MSEVASAIVTDISVLHQKSKPVEWFFMGDNTCLPSISGETEEKIEKLLAACPGNELGLSAPQIGIFERFFVASLGLGRFLFINPNLSQKQEITASTEGCLSLPGVVRCVERFYHLTIEADLIYKIKEEAKDWPISGALSLRRPKAPMYLHGRDSYVVQHECDHLEGVLLIDLPETKTSAQNSMAKKAKKRELKRQKKVDDKRTTLPPVKRNPKKQAKLLKNLKAAERRLKKRVQMQERLEFEKKETQ